MSACTVCGRRVHARGLCNRHYERQRIHGSPTAPRQVAARRSPEDRLWAMVDKSGECWTTPGTGYGKVRIGGRDEPTVSAHRLSYELANGPIPAGMQVLHRCDNPPCVRPGHLFLGSNLDNVADRVAKGRGAKGERLGSKLTEPDVVEIRRLRSQGMLQREIAERFAVTQETVSLIVLGRRWAHVRFQSLSDPTVVPDAVDVSNVPAMRPVGEGRP